MTDDSDNLHANSSLYASPCGYFPNKTAHASLYQFPAADEALELIKEQSENELSVFYNPEPPLTITGEKCQLIVYSFFLSEGYRRSSDFIYREDCPDCKTCIPIRIHVPDFSFSKNQRYLLRKNADISVSIIQEPKAFVTKEKIELMAYYELRHNAKQTILTNNTLNDTTFTEHDLIESLNSLEQENGIIKTKNPTKSSNCQNETNIILSKSYSGTINMEYRLNDTLIACGIVDTAENALSSNYFYYDISPDMMKKSLGTYSILKEIEYCKLNDIEWYYLGYWLSDCKKMSYKANFKPHQLRINDEWIEISK